MTMPRCGPGLAPDVRDWRRSGFPAERQRVLGPWGLEEKDQPAKVHVRLQLELPAEARMLTRTRWALLGYMQELGTGDETAGEVILALDEACGNVVRHAFPGGEATSGV